MGGPHCPAEQPRRTGVVFRLIRDRIVLLHAFIKKTQKTPDEELALAAQADEGI